MFRVWWYLGFEDEALDALGPDVAAMNCSLGRSDACIKGCISMNV